MQLGWFMVKPAELVSAILRTLEEEHAAAVAGFSVWLDELERRRCQIAAEGAEIRERAKRAAGG